MASRYCWYVVQMFVALASLHAAAAAAPPNIVLIVSDDQAWTDYGFMKHPNIRTPHIDRLASQSLLFTRGYVPFSLCRPSLATIITGRYPHQHGIVGNDPPVPASFGDAPKSKVQFHPDYQAVRAEYIGHIDDEDTLPELLAKHLGAVSFQSGKWWEGHYSRGGFTDGMTHGDMMRGGRHGDAGLKIGREGLQPAFDFIASAKLESKPFLLWYAPFLPHVPHNPPERLLSKYQDQTPHLAIAKYWAMCEWFDETVGDLMGELDRQELAEHTIVMYVADNGWINDSEASRYAPRSKLTQYEGGVRTPIMIRWPGKVTPRRDETHLASSIDLMPTALAACGLPVPKALPGINLLDRQQVDHRTQIFGEICEHDIQSMDDSKAGLKFRWVIDGEWKLIIPNGKRLPEAPVELFNLGQDPAEHTNLASQEPEKVAELTRLLNQWWDPDSR